MMESAYRTFWPRFWAGILDGILFLPITLIDPWVYSHINSNGVLAIWFVLSTSTFFIYEVLMHGKYGQTVGKMATRVIVLDVSLDKLSMRQAFLRDSVYIALTTVGIIIDFPKVVKGWNPYQGPIGLSTKILSFASFGWFLVELVTMLTNNKRRALHDFIAGSVVIRRQGFRE